MPANLHIKPSFQLEGFCLDILPPPLTLFGTFRINLYIIGVMKLLVSKFICIIKNAIYILDICQRYIGIHEDRSKGQTY